MKAYNYATVVDRYYHKNMVSLSKGFLDKSFPVSIYSKIKESTHFSTPSGGIFPDDELKGLDGVDYLSLPYDNITISTDGGGDSLGLLACAWHKGDEIQCAVFTIQGDTVSLMDIIVIINRNRLGNIQYSSTLHDGRLFTVEPSSINSIVFLIANFIAALTCKNISHRPVSKSDVKVSGKIIQPLYEERVLIIHANGKEIPIADYNGAGGRTLKQHFRRGHIRRHPSAGSIWITPCIVGDSEKGIIHKTYQVSD